jgi:hypothetical protein
MTTFRIDPQGVFYLDDKPVSLRVLQKDKITFYASMCSDKDWLEFEADLVETEDKATKLENIKRITIRKEYYDKQRESI